MTRNKRILIAIIIGLLSSILSYILLYRRQYYASDFQWILRAAYALIHGQDPYKVILPTGNYPFTHFFFYPLTSAFVGIPFLIFNDYAAGALFFGVSSGILAFALSNEPWRLLMFLSAPFFVAAYTAQWSPLMAVAAFIPNFNMFASCKPNLGVIAFLYNPSKKGVIFAFLPLVLAFILIPIWPFEWLAIVLHKMPSHPFPFLVGLGPFLLISIFFIKSREGRVLIASAITPQAFFYYDQFPLLLVSRNFRELLFQIIFSWVGYFGWLIRLNGAADTGQFVPLAHSYVVIFLFYPSLLILLFPYIKLIYESVRKKIKDSVLSVR